MTDQRTHPEMYSELALQAQAEYLERAFENPLELALAVIEWGVENFSRVTPGSLVMTSAMADSVMIDLAQRVDPTIPVIFLNTGFHFAETLDTLERVEKRYGINVRIGQPSADAVDMWTSGTDACCADRKVAVLDRELSPASAWMTGLRRSESATRANTQLISRDNRGLVKLCPIATWSDDDVDRYISERRLIVNRLQFEGYPSIGCQPCTKRVEDGADLRSGRWPDSDKTECGIHQ